MGEAGGGRRREEGTKEGQEAEARLVGAHVRRAVELLGLLAVLRVPRLRHVVLPLELRVNGGIACNRVLGGMQGGQQLLYLGEAACAGLGLGLGPARG